MLQKPYTKDCFQKCRIGSPKRSPKMQNRASKRAPKMQNRASKRARQPTMTPVWTLTRNGEAVELADCIDGDPTGGSIRFTEKGVYALTATVTDTLGRAFAASAEITVYPVGSVGFYLPEIFHTDDTVTIEAVFGEIGKKSAVWTLTRDGSAAVLESSLSSTAALLRIRCRAYPLAPCLSIGFFAAFIIFTTIIGGIK